MSDKSKSISTGRNVALLGGRQALQRKSRLRAGVRATQIKWCGLWLMRGFRRSDTRNGGDRKMIRTRTRLRTSKERRGGAYDRAVKADKRLSGLVERHQRGLGQMHAIGCENLEIAFATLGIETDRDGLAGLLPL